MKYNKITKAILWFILNHLPDKLFLTLQYKHVFGKKLDLKHPVTFNEKLQWLKIYDRKPEYTTMVDKFEAKKWVADRIGEQYIIPTLGVWNNFDDIDFDILPNQFVLKCTHDSGGLVIVRDKKTFDKANARKKINKCLKRNWYYSAREWPYKNVKRRIIAEEYIEDSSTGELADYKFFCFDGEVKALFVGTERGTGDVKFDYYDADFNHLDIIQYHHMSSHPLPKPQNFDLMKELASKLSEGIPHVRVDLYESNGVVYFGELTFFHHGGVTPFYPKEWDDIFGSWINLPLCKYC